MAQRVSIMHYEYNGGVDGDRKADDHVCTIRIELRRRGQAGKAWKLLPRTRSSWQVWRHMRAGGELCNARPSPSITPFLSSIFRGLP